MAPEHMIRRVSSGYRTSRGHLSITQLPKSCCSAPRSPPFPRTPNMCVANPAITWLANCGRQRHWPERSEAQLAEMVEDIFLGVEDFDELAALTDKTDPADPVAMRRALAYVEQWRLATWVGQLNSEQGVAPTTESVLGRKEAQSARLPEDVRPPAVGTSSDARARMWCRRWRLRWGARYARIRVREDVSFEEKRSKATERVNSRVAKMRLTDASFGSRFWVPF